MIWKQIHFAQLPLSVGDKLLLRSEKLVQTFIPDIELREDAYRLAIHSGHSAYDMFYGALALREQAGLLSLDKKLNRWASKQEIRIFS